MHVSSKNLLVLINDILDLSKLEAGKVEIEKSSFKIKEVIEKIEGDLKGKAEEKGLELKVETNPDVPEILLGDPQMLHNILFPMVNNGIAFTDKGAVSLMCILEGRTENSYIIGFKIQDTGIGIIKEKLDQILNTFVKVYEKDALNYDGSGLELPIIKQMIELQGGTIEVESESGKGTTFNIEIPYTSVTDIEEAGISEPQSPLISQSDLSILLVEDNEFNVMVATEEINSAFENVNLEVVENGKLAFEKVLENDFHVILMDIQMPIMNGYEATKQIRKIKGPKASVPIIAMTANVMKQEIDKCFESGMDAYISKPFETSELINKINTLVARGN
jgi:CheY-like chemotaxis protein